MPGVAAVVVETKIAVKLVMAVLVAVAVVVQMEETLMVALVALVD